MSKATERQVALSVTHEVHDELRRIAYEQRIPMRTILREGVQLALDKRRQSAGEPVTAS